MTPWAYLTTSMALTVIGLVVGVLAALLWRVFGPNDRRDRNRAGG